MAISTIWLIGLLLGQGSFGWPDLDIVDHQADLTNNTMSLRFCYADGVFESGDFKVVVPATHNQNVNLALLLC